MVDWNDDFSNLLGELSESDSDDEATNPPQVESKPETLKFPETKASRSGEGKQVFAFLAFAVWCLVFAFLVKKKVIVGT